MIAAILAAAVCHVGGQAPFLRPDHDCTPGAFKNLTLGQVRPQGAAPASGRRASLHPDRLRRPELVRDGELDHRVPFSFGGTTDRANIWPEAGSIPNTKDKLESTSTSGSAMTARCGCGPRERSSWATGSLPSRSTT